MYEDVHFRAKTAYVNAKLTKSVRTTGAIERRRMNEVDETGWAHIHQAAKKGEKVILYLITAEVETH